MVQRQLLPVVSLFLVYLVQGNNFHKIGDDDDLSIINYVAKKGYDIKFYTIKTSDGYMLSYNRISKSKNYSGKKEVILLQHGLGMSSVAFLIPDTHALAYVLVDAGFDVWLANSRGNQFSVTPDSIRNKKSQQYSIHELGVLDLSAAVKYILDVTEQRSLHYVGHSHGGAYAFALLSSDPSYQPLFGSVIALAPTTFLDNLLNEISKPSLAVKSIIRAIFLESERLELEGTYRMMTSFSELNNTICRYMDCNYKMEFLTGTIRKGDWLRISGFDPSGTSTKSVQYVWQQINNGLTFKQHDYGPKGNRKRYKSAEPPAYDLSTITIPIDIIYSDSDVIVSPKEMEYHKKVMKHVSLHRIKIKNFNHFDFIWGPKSKRVVNKQILQILAGDYKSYSQYEPNINTNTFGRLSRGGLKNTKKFIPTRFFRGKKTVSNFNKSPEEIIRSSYITLVNMLLNYESNTKVSLLHLWLNTTERGNEEKINVINDIIQSLNKTCTNRDIDDMVNVMKVFDEYNSTLNITDQLKTYNGKNLALSSTTCPSNPKESTKQFEWLVKELLPYKYDLEPQFSFSPLESTSVSNSEKVKKITKMITFLRNTCIRNCTNFDHLMSSASVLLEYITETGTSNGTDLIINNSSRNIDTKLISDDSKKIETMYENILKLLTEYESRVHSKLNYLVLLTNKLTNKEKLRKLERNIIYLNKQCTDNEQCNDIKDLTGEINALQKLSNKLSNFEKLNLTSHSIVLHIQKLNKMAWFEDNANNPEADRFIGIINRILSFESKGKIEKTYQFLLSSHVTGEEKVKKLIGRVSYLIERCVEECFKLYMLERQVKRLPKDAIIYFDYITLNCNGESCKVQKSNNLTNKNRTKLREYSRFVPVQNKKNKQLIDLDKKIRTESENVAVERNGKITNFNSRFMNSFSLTTNISMSELVEILIGRIRYLKETCVKNCKNIDNLQSELESLKKKVKLHLTSNIKGQESFFNKEKLTNKAYNREREFRMKTPTISKSSTSMNSTKLLYKTLENILLDKITSIKENCSYYCDEIDELQRKMKDLINKTETSYDDNYEKTKQQFGSNFNKNVVLPDRGQRVVVSKGDTYIEIIRALKNYAVKLGSTKVLTSLLDDIRMLKEKCLYDCKELVEFEREVKKLVKDNELSSNVKRPNKNQKQESISSIYPAKNPDIVVNKYNYLKKIVDSLKKYAEKTGLDSKMSLNIVSTNITDERLTEIILEKIKILKYSCILYCEELDELERKVKIRRNNAGVLLDIKDPNKNVQKASDPNIAPTKGQENVVNKRYELEKIIAILKKYAQKTGSTSSLSWIMQTENITDETLTVILLEKIKIFKDICTLNCEELEDLERKLKIIGSTSELLGVENPNKNMQKVSDQNIAPTREQEIVDNKRYKLDNILDSLKKYAKKTGSTINFSWIMKTKNITDETLTVILLEKINKLKNSCTLHCEELDDLERNIKNFSGANELLNVKNPNKNLQKVSDPNIDPIKGQEIVVNKRYELEKIIAILKKYVQKTGSTSNFSWIMQTENITDETLTVILLEKIKIFKDICTLNCEELEDLERKLKIIGGTSGLDAKNPNKNMQKVSDQNIAPTREQEIVDNKRYNLEKILDSLKKYAKKTGSTSNFSWIMKTKNITDETLTVILLEKIKIFKDICTLNCEELEDLERKLKIIGGRSGLDVKNPNKNMQKVFDQNIAPAREQEIVDNKRYKLEKILDSLKKYAKKTGSTSNFSWIMKTKNITDETLTVILLEKIKIFKDSCTSHCEDLDDLERKLKIIGKETGEYLDVKKVIENQRQDSDLTIAPTREPEFVVSKRNKLKKIVDGLKKYAKKTGSASNFSWNIETKTITDETFTAILLEKIKIFKDSCITYCEDLDELERQVKILSTETGELLDPNNPNKNKQKVSLPTISRKREPANFVKQTGDFMNNFNSSKSESNFFTRIIRTQNKTMKQNSNNSNIIFKTKLLFIINKLRELKYTSKSYLNYSLIESSSLSKTEKVSLLLEWVKQLKNECVANCEYFDELENEINQLSEFSTSIPTGYTTTSTFVENIRPGNNDKGVKGTDSLSVNRNYYIKLVNQFRKYDLELEILPKFNYSMLKMPNVSNSKKFYLILERLLLLKRKCTKKCNKIIELVKEMKDLEIKIVKNNIIEELDMNTFDLFSKGPTSSGLEFSKDEEYEQIKEEYIKIITYLRTYIDKIEYDFDFTNLESKEQSNENKIKTLTKQVLTLKRNCKEKCDEVELLVDRVFKLKSRLDQLSNFDIGNLDLSVPKKSHKPWTDRFKLSKPILQRVKVFEKHINSTYFSD